MMKLFTLSLGALSLALATPAGAQRQTLTQIVAASGGQFDRDWRDYDMLLNAVQAVPGIAEALNNCGDSLTLFAPNDLAFIRLARDLGYRGWDEEGAFNAIVAALTRIGNGDPIPVLRTVLLYHVAPRDLNPLQVLFAREIPTLQGGSIRPFLFILRDNDPDLRDPWLTWPINVLACNGRLHSIDRVLIPVNL
ncbi:MAG: fasciclin domain-containing protein [Planctomycetota bacterium]